MPDPYPDLYQGVFLPDLLVAALRRDPDRPVVYLGDEVLTAAEVATRSAGTSRRTRIRASCRAAEWRCCRRTGPKCCCRGREHDVGGRSTALHPLGSLDDHAYVVEDAGIETLVFDPSFAERAAALHERVPGLKRLLSLGPSEVGDDLLALAARFEPQPLVAPIVDPEDPPALAYTGGTTGQPKGVMDTYRSSAAMIQIMVAEWEWPDDMRLLVCTPLWHAGAAFFVPMLLRGGSIVVLPDFDAGAVLEAIEKYRITAMMLVPTMIYVLLDHPKFDETDLSSLQTVFYGAAPMSPTRLQEAIRRLGPIFFQFYGQTECPKTITRLRKEEHDPDDLARLATCGRPVPWVHVALLDDDGNEVARGEPGEICVRGPLVMSGYWNKPEETAASLCRWLAAHRRHRPRGRARLPHDRRPQEGHDRLVVASTSSRARSRTCSPRIPRSRSRGDRRARREVGRGGQGGRRARGRRVSTPAELIALVKDRKGPHYAPKTVDVAESIPVTAVGKPDKKALRARYWSGTGRQVG